MTSQDHSPAKSHIITTAFIYQDLIIGLVFLRWLWLSLCDLVASSSEAEVGELPDRKCRCDEWRRRTGSPLGYIRVTRVWLYSDCELERSSRKKMSCFEWLIQLSHMICNFKTFHPAFSTFSNTDLRMQSYFALHKQCQCAGVHKWRIKVCNLHRWAVIAWSFSAQAVLPFSTRSATADVIVVTSSSCFANTKLLL